MQCESCTGGCPCRMPLTPAEISVLSKLAVTPFLPVASHFNLKMPIYLEQSEYQPEIYGRALLALQQKGLIRIDYDLPLVNFEYTAYKNYPMHGSMALTGAGQDAIEQLEYMSTR